MLLISALLGLVLLSIALLHAWRDYATNSALVAHVPGHRQVFDPFANLVQNCDVGRLASYLSPVQSLWRENRLFDGFDEPIVSLATSRTCEVRLRDPEMIGQVIFARSGQVDKPIERYAPLNWCGANLVTSKGDTWSRHRRVCNPAFVTDNIRLGVDAVNVQVNRIVHKWSRMLSLSNESCDDDERIKVLDEHVRCDVVKDSTRLTLSVLLESLFGVSSRKLWTKYDDADTEERDDIDFADAVETCTKNFFTWLTTPSFVYKLPIAPLKRLHRCFGIFFDFLQDVTTKEMAGVNERSLIKLLKDSNAQYKQQQEDADRADDDDDQEGDIRCPRKRVKHTLDDTEMVGNAFMFLVAGHETTAHTLAFALGLLAANPDKLRLLQEEVDRVLPNAWEDVTLETYDALPYTLMVFNETLRMFPPVKGIPKKMEQAMQVGPHVLPAGVVVILDAWALHHNPDVWPNPDVFEPERFAPEAVAARHKCAFIPFSHGARKCLGTRFASVTAVLLLARLMRLFGPQLPPDVTDMSHYFATQSFITTAPKHRMFVHLKPRVDLSQCPF